jgi:transposase
MDTSEPTKRTRVRAYAPQFKAQVLAECSQPGASVAKVALANGLNANMIHTWRRQARDAVAPAMCGAGAFVPLQLAGSPVDAAVPPIRIECARAQRRSRSPGLRKLPMPARRGYARC